MKKIITAILICISFAGFGQNKNNALPVKEEKSTPFYFNDSQLNMLWNTLGFCKTSIQTSKSAVVDVIEVVKMIDSLQKIISFQYQKQIEAVPKEEKKK